MITLTTLLTLFIINIFYNVVVAQTPADFQPGSKIRLGVAFPGQDISPAGAVVNSLESKF
jgi:hypothetical protein